MKGSHKARFLFGLQMRDIKVLLDKKTRCQIEKVCVKSVLRMRLEG